MKNEEYKKIIEKIIESVDEGIHFIDTSGKTVIYNDAMEKLEHMSKDDILDKSFIEISKIMNIKNSTLLEVLNSKKSIINNVQKYMNKYGKNITTINSTIPIFFEDEFLGVLEISKDMTQIESLSHQIIKLEENKSPIKSSPDRVIYKFEDVMGNSESIKNVLNKSKKAAKSDATVLIYGETGTGKEIISQSIHYESKRKNYPFIAQNCAALPEALLEGLLFGTSKGGFTGAIDRPGLFEQADNGTILLDEINSMSLQLQAKLLRVLQERHIRRVGATKEVFVDVRVIATTNENPKQLMENGKIRKDLYYRLNVIYIEIPPLRDRKEDIILLSNKFIEKYNKKLNKGVKYLTSSAIDALMKNFWQGNVRELENVIYSSISMLEDESVLTDDMLNLNDLKSIKSEKNYMVDIEAKPLDWIIGDIEEMYINEALEKSEYNITKAAAILGITRQNLQYKIKKYNIRIFK